MRWLALAVVFLGGCQIEIPSVAKTRALELKIAGLEKQLADSEGRDIERKLDLDICISRADTAYWKYIQLNGRVAKRDENGTTYKAPAHIWRQAAEDKANAIEECKTVWGK